jgi:hypothetical protein
MSEPVGVYFTAFFPMQKRRNTIGKEKICRRIKIDCEMMNQFLFVLAAHSEMPSDNLVF